MTIPLFISRELLVPVACLFFIGLATLILTGLHPAQAMLTKLFIFAAFALSWNIIGGFGGQLSVGHALFFGIGAYVPTLMAIHLGIPSIFGLFAAVALSVLVALGIGASVFRLRGVYFALATLVYPLIVAHLVEYAGLHEQEIPFQFGSTFLYLQPEDPRVLSLIALLWLSLVYLISRSIEKSGLGLRLNAVRSDEESAAASGIDGRKAKTTGFMLSAGLSAVCGTLYSSLLLTITPESVFGLGVSVQPVLMSMVGGLATSHGPVIGAIILIPLDYLLVTKLGGSFPGLSGVVFGVLLIVVVLASPRGVYTLLTELFDSQQTSVWKYRLKEWGQRFGLWSQAPDPLSRDRQAERDITALETSTERSVDLHGNPLSQAPLLSITGICKSFGGLNVLNDVNMNIQHGEIVGLVGANGAGKTTFFNVISGYILPKAGQIQLHDRDLTNLSVFARARAGLGRTFQVPRLFANLTVLESVAAVHAEAGLSFSTCLSNAASNLDTLGLYGLAGKRPNELSTAELRLVEIARAIALHPRLILLDEFLAGVGKSETPRVIETIHQVHRSGITVLAIEHSMQSLVRLVERLIVLDQGAVIAEGNPTDVVENPIVLEAYLGQGWKLNT